jgi:hypothetical protein
MKRQGIALISVVLLATALSAALGVALRSTLVSNRASGTSEATTMAGWMADAGIQEGLAWVARNPLTEYGQPASGEMGYTLVPYVGGYAPGSSCATRVAATAGAVIDTNCPVYRLAVRHKAEYNQTTRSRFALPARVFPSGTPVYVPVTASNLVLNVTNASGTYAFCPTPSSCGATQAFISQIGPINFPSGGYIRFNLTHSQSPGAALVTFAGSPLWPVVIGNGEVVVDATAVVGGVTVRRHAVLLANGSVRYYNAVTDYTSKGLGDPANPIR